MSLILESPFPANHRIFSVIELCVELVEVHHRVVPLVYLPVEVGETAVVIRVG
jgi:hypothetical protein